MTDELKNMHQEPAPRRRKPSNSGGEIAVIDSRSPDAVSDDDLRRALRELRGRLSSELPPEEGYEFMATRHPTDLAVDNGHPSDVHVTPPDGSMAAERMAEEGAHEEEESESEEEEESSP